MNWGLRDSLWSESELAAKARAAGYRWICLEYNDYGNAVRAPTLKQACAANELLLAIWMTRNFTAADARAAVLASGADGFCAEGETPAQMRDGSPNPQAQDWPALVAALSDLDIGKAVATNWSPFTHGNDGTPAPEIAKPLLDDDWHVLPYVYPAEHAGITPERQQFYAQHYTYQKAPAILEPGTGWYHTEPVLGCYGGYTLADFPTRVDYLGWSVWAGEYVL